MSITWPIHACALLVLPTLAAAESSPWTWSPVCGVSVNHVRASMHDPAQAFAATYGGAVLRTDDWGVSSRQLSAFDPDAHCLALVLPRFLIGHLQTTEGGLKIVILINCVLLPAGRCTHFASTF